MISSPRLEIRHCPEHGPRSFRVCRDGETQPGPVMELPSPFAHPVAGLPDSHLMRELRWYLEEFLDYPFAPNTLRAERLLASLKDWGRTAFGALFGRHAPEESLAVVADDPSLFGWPWEALADEQGRWLSETCGLLRQPASVARVGDIPAGLARDRVRILLVIARSGENDVRFRSLARPVVELIERERLPAEVEVLRPPTFRQLRKHLEEQNRAGRPYHLVHFDGHGHSGLCPDPKRRDGRRTGWLLFEDASGDPDWIDAERFSQTLSECGVPAVVLNACQSALVEEDATASSASVATALLRAGVRAVVAMSYSVYVSAARVFMPAFYRQMFATGRLSDAVHAGRRALHDRPERVCARGTFPLRDALVPVLYQQAPLAFEFSAQADRVETISSLLPDEVRQGFDSAGFVGRDGPILQLERALHDPHHSAILIQGMGGQGKTALAKAFLRWLEQTGGLGAGVFWFSFESCRNVEAFFNRLGEQLFGPDFGRQKWEERLRQVTEECRKKRVRILWDNFESVLGVPGTEVMGLLSDEDAAILRRFLFDLRQGRSKVLITSRSPETWLDPRSGQPTSVLRLRSLGGLDGEERWELARTLLREHGLTAELEVSELRDLVGALDGHPLAMRVVLPKLVERSSRELLEALRDKADALRSGEADAEEVRLFAPLALVADDLPEAWRPLLVGLSLHEGFVDGDSLAAMARQMNAGWQRETVDAFLLGLVVGGLLLDCGERVYRMHPVLAGYLRKTAWGEEREHWERLFTAFMGEWADYLGPLAPHKQRGVLRWHLGNFQAARTLARQHGMSSDYASLTQTLAVFFQNQQDFHAAGRLFRALAEHHQHQGIEEHLAAAYHQVGMVAQEERDFSTAREWYNKALAISERNGLERGSALTYHQLGLCAEESRDFTNARSWYVKSLAITERLGDEHHTALTYHQLGRVAEEERDFATARMWYLESLTIKEKLGNEAGAAATYHQLGMVAQEERDLSAARAWYSKALAITERLGIEHYSAGVYHQLGRVAEEELDLTDARRWYLKSLAIKEKHANEHSAAITYHQLGTIDYKMSDLAGARQWYLKSLAIKEKQGDQHGAAMTYHQLGVIAQEERDHAAARSWYLQSLAIESKQGDNHRTALTYHQLGRVAQEERDYPAARGWYLKALAINERDDHKVGIAGALHQLGVVAQEERDYSSARARFLESLAISESLGLEHYSANTYHQLGQAAEEEGDFAAAQQWYAKALAVEEKLGDHRRAGVTCRQLGMVAQKVKDHGAARGWYVKALALGERLQGHEAAGLCHQLGMVAEEEKDYSAARRWYQKSLAISEGLGNESIAASTYHHLGLVAQEEGDFAAARGWYVKALAIKEKHGNEQHVASTCGQLGMLAWLEGRLAEAATWLLRAIHAFTRAKNGEGVRHAASNYQIAYREVPEIDRPRLRQLWIDAGHDPAFLDEVP